MPESASFVSPLQSSSKEVLHSSDIPGFASILLSSQSELSVTVPEGWLQLLVAVEGSP